MEIKYSIIDAPFLLHFAVLSFVGILYLFFCMRRFSMWDPSTRWHKFIELPHGLARILVSSRVCLKKIRAGVEKRSNQYPERMALGGLIGNAVWLVLLVDTGAVFWRYLHYGQEDPDYELLVLAGMIGLYIMASLWHFLDYGREPFRFFLPRRLSTVVCVFTVIMYIVEATSSEGIYIMGALKAGAPKGRIFADYQASPEKQLPEDDIRVYYEAVLHLDQQKAAQAGLHAQDLADCAAIYEQQDTSCPANLKQEALELQKRSQIETRLVSRSGGAAVVEISVDCFAFDALLQEVFNEEKAGQRGQFRDEAERLRIEQQLLHEKCVRAGPVKRDKRKIFCVYDPGLHQWVPAEEDLTAVCKELALLTINA